MYRYDEFDAQFVAERVAQFRDQVQRRLTGALSEDQFKLHRLMNGVYLQLHAYMLRVAVPYGVLSSRQLRKLAHIARRYDKGFGHFTTRQNIQFNWPALADCPDILDELASVEMHAIQTSGNCIRNVTADQFAGAAADEVADPRPYAEILRQWSSLHPEYSFLPRKFKIAVTGAPHDRAAIQVHDIGLAGGSRARPVHRFHGLYRRRPWPHAVRCHPNPRLPARGRPARPTRMPSCASTISRGGGTTSTRRASRSWCTRRAPTPCARRSKRSSPVGPSDRSRCPRPTSPRSRPISHCRRSTADRRRPRSSKSGAGSIRSSPPLSPRT